MLQNAHDRFIYIICHFTWFNIERFVLVSCTLGQTNGFINYQDAFNIVTVNNVYLYKNTLFFLILSIFTLAKFDVE